MTKLTRLLGIVSALLATLPFQARSADADGRALLWEVTSPTTTVYLLGTIHVGSDRLYPLPAAIETAYARSAVIALEADPTDASALMSVSSTMYQPPDGLDQHVPAALYRDAQARMAATGLPGEIARMMKPWLLSMTLTMAEMGRLGFDAGRGIDLYLATRAKQDGKRLVELESMALQIALLDSLSPELQTAMLQSTVDGLKSGSLGADMTAMVEAWRRGDAVGLDELAQKDLASSGGAAANELRARLYDQRNRAMSDRIRGLLAGREIVMVAVGAGHMTGPTGITTLLAAKGYKVRRL